MTSVHDALPISGVGRYWYDIIVHVELVVYDVWCSEDDNTGFLSVVLDDLGRLYL